MQRKQTIILWSLGLQCHCRCRTQATLGATIMGQMAQERVCTTKKAADMVKQSPQNQEGCAWKGPARSALHLPSALHAFAAMTSSCAAFYCTRKKRAPSAEFLRMVTSKPCCTSGTLNLLFQRRQQAARHAYKQHSRCQQKPMWTASILSHMSRQPLFWRDTGSKCGYFSKTHSGEPCWRCAQKKEGRPSAYSTFTSIVDH